MGSGHEKKELDYLYLVDKYQMEMQNRCNHLEIKANKFIENKGYSDKVILNHSMLNIMVIDYFADIDRLKDFHDIKQTNKNKITAYTVYWWLRRRPLQVTNDLWNSTIEDAKNNEKYVYVNEEFATTLILKDIFNGNKEKMKNNILCEKYIQHVFYYLKYRSVDAQGIEWLLATAEIGKEIGSM